jgi:hypothetical protein
MVSDTGGLTAWIRYSDWDGRVTTLVYAVIYASRLLTGGFFLGENRP